jgi:plasmid stabilization system protein ParE
MAEEKIRIIWSERAEKQLFSILDYWIKRNKSNVYALKLVSEVDDKLKFIAQNPLASVATTYPKTRKCSMGKYSILYKNEQEVIFITAFWDNRQSPNELDKIL